MIKINQGTPQAEVKLVVDLGGKLPWFGCRKGYNSSSYHPVSCMLPQCSQANKPVSTCALYNGTAKPYNNACIIYIRNPVTRYAGRGDLISDLMTVTYNFNLEVSQAVTSLRRFAFGCAASSNFFTRLSKASKGVTGLGRSSALSLVPQINETFYSSNPLTKKNYKGIADFINKNYKDIPSKAENTTKEVEVILDTLPQAKLDFGNLLVLLANNFTLSDPYYC
ncbi:basic 7S globulin-like [Papaver somniferum]|uniref:basic 7S globulin-like n=1 Tax=Papaver somniferum TaxID=3469 RepID=UPI000E6F4CDE|nr:basic 7S globulin-like [Papaver somniferum]